MKTWLKRVGCLVFILIWLFLISLPGFAFYLAAQQQIQIGQDPQNHLRIFLIQESHAEGLGAEWARPAEENPTCIHTSVNYFMWSGSADDVTYCQCFDDQNNPLSPSRSGNCSSP